MLATFIVVGVELLKIVNVILSNKKKKYLLFLNFNNHFFLNSHNHLYYKQRLYMIHD